LTYNRQLGVLRNNARYGIEVAANFLEISLHNNAQLSGSGMRTTDAYPSRRAPRLLGRTPARTKAVLKARVSSSGTSRSAQPASLFPAQP